MIVDDKSFADWTAKDPYEDVTGIETGVLYSKDYYEGRTIGD